MTARRPADDTGSLALALLLTLVGVSLTALLVPMVVRQIDTTRASAQRIQALSAAQAGIDVALGHIRAANNGSGAGVLAKLPCSPLTGRVSGAGNATYVVTFAYYAADPIGGGPTIDCSVGGYGVRTAPSYALIRATGTDQPAGGAPVSRTLQASYVFSTTNQNIPGGLIHAYKTDTSTDLCLDAGSGAPTLGTSVRMQPCSPGSSRQKFAYNTNLTLTLVASKTATQPLGMCLDAGSPHAAGSLVQFQPCSATTKPQQQWSLNDSANFEGTTDGVNLDNLCFNVQSQNTAGSLVVLGATSAGKCHKAPYDNIQTFSPEAAVGAGAAGPAAGQLVNFKQFGRCIDVTDQRTDRGFLIVWPCKQAPNPANVRWNQKFALPAFGVPGRITTNPGSLYCLQSPGSVAPARYVQTVICPGNGMPPNMTWTVYGDTGSYVTGYRIIDGFGNCLTPTDPTATPPDLFNAGQQISKLVVAPCSASTLQKWNAPPNILQALPLKDIGEK
jgi:type II secretory pathway pseudopilin PulG